MLDTSWRARPRSSVVVITVTVLPATLGRIDRRNTPLCWQGSEMTMELRYLRYFLAVAETGNFTRAAAQCFVAQSALSEQIARLEAEVGALLFARTSRAVRLTAAG